MPFSRWTALATFLVATPLFFAPAASHAGVFHTARTLKPSALSASLEAQVNGTDPTSSQYGIHAGIGVAPNLDLELWYTHPTGNSYGTQELGLNVEFGVLRDFRHQPAFSVAVGSHLEDFANPQLDATLLLSKVLGRVEPLVAFDTDIMITSGGLIQQSRGVFGLNIHISPVVEFMLEGGAGLKGAPSYLGAGLNFYLVR